jgi:hypothetical protein
MFTFVSHESHWLALSPLGARGIGTLSRMLWSSRLLDVGPRDCHERSGSVAI